MRHRVPSHFNWSLKHVQYYLYNRLQALTIFRVAHQKQHKRTLGDIIPVLRTFLVFTKLDVLLEVVTKINSGGMLYPFDWQTVIDFSVDTGSSVFKFKRFKKSEKAHIWCR